jgi:hypothetical protein
MLASRDITYIIKIKGIPTQLNPSWAPSVMRARPADWVEGSQFFKSIICPYVSFVHRLVLLHE